MPNPNWPKVIRLSHVPEAEKADTIALTEQDGYIVTVRSEGGGFYEITGTLP